MYIHIPETGAHSLLRRTLQGDLAYPLLCDPALRDAVGFFKFKVMEAHNRPAHIFYNKVCKTIKCSGM